MEKKRIGKMAAINCKNQTVFIGDNREAMLGLNSACVDLIATDPPYSKENKEKRFHHVFGSPQTGKQKPGFDDKCAGCDKHYDANVMQVDHDFPRVKGGQDNVENLQVLCSGCNSRKGTKRLAQLREINRRLGLMKKEN